MTIADAPVNQVRPAWPGEMVQAGGAALHVRYAEPAAAGLDPALYVHGLGGSAHNWTDLMGELRDLVDGEAVDLPGFGESPPPARGDYSISAHARAVIGLLERRDRGPVHLFGNSLGGAVSTRVSALRPDLVRTLTLISPALPDLRPRATNALLGLYGVPGFSRLIGRVLAGRPPQERIAALMNLVYADPSRVPEVRRQEAIEDYGRRMGLPHAQEALVWSLRGLLTEYLDRSPDALWRQAARVRVPTLLIYGQRDKLVAPRTAYRAVSTFPRARLLVLPDSGHVSMMEHPEIVARAFRELACQASRRNEVS
jgi:pimeloyl-ACP methyl ester carboxylesterase